MKILQAVEEDAKKIMPIIEEARSFQLSYGNMQWAYGYPSEDLIKEDIIDGIGYKIMMNDEIAGHIAIVSHDDSYDEINGKWLTDGPYIAIHRLALSDKWRGQGLFKSIIEKVIELGKLKGASSLRIDTDNSNPIMKHLLEKLGFINTGSVIFEGSAKPSYELVF